jgi:hypothetical protein
VAYAEIKNNGLLSRMRWRVYDYLYHHGPLTANEIDAGLMGPAEVNPSYHKRLSELENAGTVREVGERACRISGRNCIEWDVTANLPNIVTPAHVPQPPKAVLARALQELAVLHTMANQNGQPFSRDLLRVCAWVGYKAGTFVP